MFISMAVMLKVSRTYSLFWERRRSSVVVKALCCTLEGRGIKSWWGGFFKGQENVDLCFHSPICLHGIVLN
jgi:hypothetical protein